MKGVSIVICCYNSGKRLIPTLKHLAKQQRLNGVDYEIILVENNCTDDTVSIASQTWTDLGIPFSLVVVSQPVPGLRYAKDKGVGVAKFNYIVMCDDDNWLCDTFIYNIYQFFESMPNVAAIGGVGEAVFETEPPGWFTIVEGFGYAVGDQGRKTGFVEAVYGAGMAIRKDVYLAVNDGNHNPVLTGRTAMNLSSGEDVEMCLLLRKAGYHIFFDKSISFKHFITKHRLNWQYYLELRTSFGRASAYLQLYNKNQLTTAMPSYKKSRWKLFAWLFRLTASNIKYVLFPNYFKGKSCANFIQYYSMVYTLFVDYKRIQFLANDVIIKDKDIHPVAQINVF